MTNQYGLSPFLVKPKFAERVWGKTNLSPWFGETGTTEKVGEAWLTGPECVIANGDYAGRTLRDVAEQCVGTLGDGEFPLLVKMLFPAEKLSVQVHPNDEEARAIGLPRGKTECWYVLEAEAGAKVACGLKAGTTLEQVKASVSAGGMEELLEMLPVEEGDMVLVDAGTVHAIGPGVVLLEVQQMSDTTYRLFDYGRGRELHLGAGMAVVKTKTRAGKVATAQGDGYTRLIQEKYFVVDRFEVPAGLTFEMGMDGVGCVVGISGEAAVNAVRFGAGQAVVMALGSVTMSSAKGAVFVRVFAPEG